MPTKPGRRKKPTPPRQDRWASQPEVLRERVRLYNREMQDWHEWKLRYDKEMAEWSKHACHQRYVSRRDRVAASNTLNEDVEELAADCQQRCPITYAELCDLLARNVIEASTQLLPSPPSPPPLLSASAAAAEVAVEVVCDDTFEADLAAEVLVPTAVEADVLQAAARCNFSAAAGLHGKPPPVLILSLDRPLQFESLLNRILADYTGWNRSCCSPLYPPHPAASPSLPPPPPPPPPPAPAVDTLTSR